MSVESALDRWVALSPGTTRPVGKEEPEEGDLLGYAGVVVELPIVYRNGKPEIYVPQGEGLAEELWRRIIPIAAELAEETYT